tara:strand:+ start:1139 stop:2146 length:1008 start_codon:yes stop_codon:yes gene_type:complete
MIKWGILGLGNMANKFAEAILEVENAKLVSISSLSKKKAESFGRKFDINERYRFNTYEELINCKEVDAVYIATLNNTHANLIIKSADAGKSILCEKPMSINNEELNLVFNKLNNTNVFFLEAIAYRSHPQIKELTNLISSDVIGNIEKIESSFGFSVKNFLKFIPNHRLFNKALGGGSILDIGCYPVSFGLLIAKILKKGDTPLKYTLVDSKGRINFRGTDDEAYTKIKFENLFDLEANVSIKNKFENSSTIFGSKGKLKVLSPWLPNKTSIIEVSNKIKKYKKEIICKYSTYANTIKIASDSIEKKKNECDFPNMTWQESKENSKILTEWKSRI